MMDLSRYELEVLRQDEEFTLDRGRERAGGPTVLALMTTAAQAPPQSFERIQHEYSLADALDSGWSAHPLGLTSYSGRPVLILEDFGGEPLDCILDRSPGQPLELTRFLTLAIEI